MVKILEWIMKAFQPTKVEKRDYWFQFINLRPDVIPDLIMVRATCQSEAWHRFRERCIFFDHLSDEQLCARFQLRKFEEEKVEDIIKKNGYWHNHNVAKMIKNCNLAIIDRETNGLR